MHIASTEKCLCPANTPTPAQFCVQAPNSIKLGELCRYRMGRLVLPAATLDFSMVRVSLGGEEFTLRTGSILGPATWEASHPRLANTEPMANPRPQTLRGPGDTWAAAGPWHSMASATSPALLPPPAQAPTQGGSSPAQHNHSHHKARRVPP